MKRIKKILIPLAVLAALFILFIIYIITRPQTLTVSEYEISSPKIPSEFDGFRIIQLSDLHCDNFGENNSELVAEIGAAKPDVIFITGDLIDTRMGPAEIGLSLAAESAKIAPTYLITGNHECHEENFHELQPILEDAGITVLRNGLCTLEKDGASVTLAGIDDLTFFQNEENDLTFEEILPMFEEKLAEILAGADGYTVLLSHRPDLIETYAKSGVDLVFCGHAHGGQFRLPFIGGLYAPGQGIFPRYTEGVHALGDTKTVISRGLGDSSFPFRLNNPPEIVAVTLRHE